MERAMTYAGPNAAQAEFWNDQAGPMWAELQERLDEQIEPLGAAALRALAAAPGERVLDIGCGCGQTTWRLAEQVGPTGRVVGLDISRTMLEVARGRPAALDAAQPRFVESDAQTADLGAGGFDAAFSRFGWMFFADPVAAFANIRRHLRPGGRLALVTWRSMAENPLFTVPAQAAAPYIDLPPPPEPAAPGPFAFADRARIEQVLADAGFSHVGAEPFEAPVGTDDVDTQLTLALKVGPLGAALRTSPELADSVRPAVRTSLEGYLTPDGVRFPAAVWIVTARA
jgi:SAM-dependent methyltransferase